MEICAILEGAVFEKFWVGSIVYGDYSNIILTIVIIPVVVIPIAIMRLRSFLDLIMILLCICHFMT